MQTHTDPKDLTIAQRDIFQLEDTDIYVRLIHKDFLLKLYKLCFQEIQVLSPLSAHWIDVGHIANPNLTTVVCLCFKAI